LVFADLRNGFDHQPLHLPHRVFPAPKHRLGDDGVADVEFLDARQGGDGLDVVVMQAVAGVDVQAEAMPCSTARRMRASSASPPGPSASAKRPVWISTTGAPADGRLPVDAASASMNRETRMPASASGRRHPRILANCPATSRPPSVVSSCAPFRHQADILRLDLQGDAEHFLGDGHFQVHLGLQEGRRRCTRRHPGCGGDPRAGAG
jgi:hypothetical protein